MEKCPISCGTHHPHQRPTLNNPENPVNPDSKLPKQRPTLKNSRNPENPDSKPGYRAKCLFSPPHIHGVPLELKIFLNCRLWAPKFIKSPVGLLKAFK